MRLQRIRISVSLFFPRCCSEATTRSRAYASARTTFGRGRPLAGPEEERTSPCPAHCPSGRDETRPNSRRNADARSLRRQPQLGHVIGDAATQPNGNDVECTCRDVDLPRQRVEEAVLPTPHQVDKLAGVIDAEGAGEIPRTVRGLTASSGT